MRMQRYTCAGILSKLSLASLFAFAVACATGDATPGPTSGAPGTDSGTNSGTDSGSHSGDDDGSVGNGGDSGNGGTPSVCDGAGTRALTVDDAFIDDFEEATI